MEQKRNSEGLYHLIKSLSLKERRLVKEYISIHSKGESSTKYAILFDVFVSLKSYDPTALIPSTFFNKRALKDSSSYLIGKVLEYLAVIESGPWNELTVIEKAIEKGFFSLAIRMIEDVIDRSSQSMRIDFQLEVLRIQKKLVKYYPRVSKSSKPIGNELRLLKESSAFQTSKYYAQLFRENFRNGLLERISLFEMYRDKVDELYDPSFHPRTRAKILRMKVTWLVLGKELFLAKKSHDSVLRIMEANNEAFSSDEHREETLFQIVLLSNFGEFEEAEKLVYELGALEGENEIENQRIIGAWIYGALLVSACSAKVELGRRAYKELQKHDDIFEDGRRALLLHFASLVFSYMEEWDEVLNIRARISRLYQDNNEGITRYSPVIRAMCYYELGDYKSSRFHLHEFAKATNSLNSEYFNAISNAFNILLVDHDGPNRKFTPIRSIAASLPQILENPVESQYSEPFDFSGWLKSTIEGTKFIDQVLSKQSPGFLRFKFNA